MEEESVTIRARRQMTLPRKVCEALGIGPGDRLVLEVSDGVLIARPRQAAALDALRELQRAFADSGVTEKELLESGRQIRDELFREKYPELARKHGI